MTVTQASRELGPSFQGVDESLLDYAVRIGTTAKLEGIKRHQLEQLILSLDAYPNHRSALLVTAVFAKRQMERRKKQEKRQDRQGKQQTKPENYESTADIVADAMGKLYDMGRDVDDARLLLNLAKWVYEALGETEIKETVDDFRKFVDKLIAGKIGGKD